MEAKDTVMNDTTKRQFIDDALLLQAEISFKAGLMEAEERIWRVGEVFMLKPDCVNFIDKGKLNPECKERKMLEHGVHYPYSFCPMSCYLYKPSSRQ